jgi:hypothetical protein
LTGSTKISLCKAVLIVDDSPAPVTATQLRGYLGNLFVEDAEFHHHSDRSFHYPLIQYKKIDGRLIVVGLQNYAPVLLNRVAQLDRIIVAGEAIRVHTVDIHFDEYDVDAQTHHYQFVTPWIALNENNYAKFRNMAAERRRPFLEQILVGSTLSALKGLGIYVNHRVVATISQYKSVKVRVHQNDFEAFHAHFSLNVGLPDFIGLGKSVSKGFGSVRRI